MRAEEFILENIPVSNKSLSGGIINRGEKPTMTPIGSGVQALVYSASKNPNIVLKMCTITGTNDPVYHYTNIFLDHQDNKFFPKIFKTKMFKLKNLTDQEVDWLESFVEYLPISHGEQYILMVVSERLQDYPNAGVEMLCNHLGITNTLLKANVIRHDTPMYVRFAMAFKDPKLRHEMAQTTTDKDFAEAITALEPLFANKEFEADMHFGNVMRRKNGQAVIIDPVTLWTPED